MKPHQLSIFFVILACLCSNLLKAQQPASQYFIPSVFQQSPGASEFAKYGDYPVNLYSGLPEISIPLYTVQSGSLSIPISLNYHASGIKVDDSPGWVGAGWSINSGGMITRRVMGTPDDGAGGYLSNTWKDASILHPGTYDADLDYLRYVVQVRNASGYDTRPDIFSYDIPGHSGRFFYNSKDSMKIEKVPFAPLAITGKPVNGFDIRDEHGTIFRVGTNNQETTGSSDDHGNSLNAVTSWMLDQMISQNRRDTISFAYQQQTIQNPPQTGQTINVEDLLNTSFEEYGVAPCSTSYLNVSTQAQNNNSYAVVQEKDASQINFKNGYVKFNLSPNYRTDLRNITGTTAYSLDNIQVWLYNFGTKQYELQKTIKFFITYFNTVTGVTGRTRLDSIEVWDKAGSITQHYNFIYNNKPTPVYGSFSKDFWGYYNGKMDGVSSPVLIPQTVVSYQSSGTATPYNINIGSSDPTSRNPDSTFMQAGVLKSIYYPTGGHTTFAYQTNRYFDGSGVMHLTGGLRVDTISSYDGISSTPIVKTYQYNISRVNAMITNLTGVINYGFFTNTSTATCFVLNGGDPQVAEQKRVRTYYSESAASLTPTEGNPVAYKQVTEYIGTPTNNIGKSVYTYRDTTDFWDGAATATLVPTVYDYFFARGQLLDKSDYLRKSDGTYQIVKEQLNSYSQFPQKVYAGIGLVVGQQKIVDGAINLAYASQTAGDFNDANRFPFDDYDIVSDDNYQTSSKTITYDTSDPTKFTATLVNYTYDDTTHMQPVTVSRNDSKGNTRITTTKYPYNYASGNTVIDTMKREHMYAEPIEKIETYTVGATTTTTGSQLNVYKMGTYTGSIVPATISVLNIPTPITNFTPATVSSGNLSSDSRYTQMISFDSYDAQNNILQYTPRNSTPVSILWDYLYALPIGQVKNATSSGSISQAFYTSFEAPRRGGWFYSGTPMYDVTAPTGSYSYPLSSGSVSLNIFDSSKSYVLSLWSNNGAPSVTAGSSLTGTPLRTASGWTYYEYTVPTSVSSITITGSMSIDELRLYPVDAQMITYTYDVSGLRSIADTKGQINYFEYDFAQRLKNIKDWNGNIVKNFGYHNYDMVVSNDAMGASTFTRNNCPTGTSPQSTTFSVPAGKYYSSTKASANAEALYDLNTNGQIKANNPAICGCPVTTVSFTLTNSTGISGFQATFSGQAPFNFPSSGSTIVQVPVGTYTTLTVGPVGSATHTFTLVGSQTFSNVHSATFNSVTIATTGGTSTQLTIQ